MEDLFTNEQEKAEARTVLIGFTDLQGWKLIEKALNANAHYLESQLRDQLRTASFTSLEEAHYLQKRIDDITAFKNLPETLLRDAQPEVEDDTTDEVYE